MVELLHYSDDAIPPGTTGLDLSFPDRCPVSVPLSGLMTGLGKAAKCTYPVPDRREHLICTLHSACSVYNDSHP